MRRSGIPSSTASSARTAKNWAGKPLDSYETVLNYARSTTTCGGLKVKAYLVRKDYPKGVKVTDEQMKQLCLNAHITQPARTYTLKPR